ncbi:unnamed protein product [Discula destructiva]
MHFEDASPNHRRPRRDAQKCALLISGFAAIGKSTLKISGNTISNPNQFKSQAITYHNTHTGKDCREIPGVWRPPVPNGESEGEGDSGAGKAHPVFDLDSRAYNISPRNPIEDRAPFDLELYMSVVRQAIQVPDAIVLGPSKVEFRAALRKEGIDYVCVWPESGEREEWLRREEERRGRATTGLYRRMADRWDELMEADGEDTSPKVVLGRDDYLGMHLQEILRRYGFQHDA